MAAIKTCNKRQMPGGSRTCSLPLIPALAICFLALAGCQTNPRAPDTTTNTIEPARGSSTATGDAVSFDSPGIPMTQRLDMMIRAINPEHVLNLNQQKVVLLRSELANEKDPQLLLALVQNMPNSCYMQGRRRRQFNSWIGKSTFSGSTRLMPGKRKKRQCV